MKKLLLPILLLLFIVNSVAAQENKKIFKGEAVDKKGFILKGTLKGDYSGYIYLGYGKIKDSIEIKNNQFKFKGHVEKPIQGWLHLQPEATVAFIYIENSNINIQTNYKRKKSVNILTITNIEGSHSAIIKKEYADFYQKNEAKSNFKELLFKKLQIYLKENKNHPFTGEILGQLATISPILSKNELLSLYTIIDTAKQHETAIKEFKMGIESMSKYGIGKPFIDFKLPNIQEKEIGLNMFKGKITLVDFWASWCTPCRKKHPELVNLKNKFKDSNFNILSISIDKNKADWVKAVKEDGLTWTNVIDINKNTYNELNLLAIPHSYLIDEEGKIIGVNLSTEKIETILKSQL